jgi:hypothetical protein
MALCDAGVVEPPLFARCQLIETEVTRREGYPQIQAPCRGSTSHAAFDDFYSPVRYRGSSSGGNTAPQEFFEAITEKYKNDPLLLITTKESESGYAQATDEPGVGKPQET